MYRRSMFISLTLIVAGLALSPNYQASEAYRIVAGDAVSVSYRYTPEYNSISTVQADGSASFPLIGQVVVSGSTLNEVETLITSAASARLNSPEVYVSVKESEKPFFIVGGEVANPGRFEIRHTMTVVRAIQLAGGFRSSANRSKVLLVRQGEPNSKIRVINVQQMISGRQLAEDVALVAGDMLIVERSGLAKSEPYLKLFNPTSYGVYMNPGAF